MFGQTLTGINVQFNADLKGLNAGLSKVSGSLQGLSSKFRSVGSTLSLALTAPITAFGVGIAKSAGDFEAAMNRVQALTNATNKEFTALSEIA